MDLEARKKAVSYDLVDAIDLLDPSLHHVIHQFLMISEGRIVGYIQAKNDIDIDHDRLVNQIVNVVVIAPLHRTDIAVDIVQDMVVNMTQDMKENIAQEMTAGNVIVQDIIVEMTQVIDIIQAVIVGIVLKVTVDMTQEIDIMTKKEKDQNIPNKYEKCLDDECVLLKMYI